MSRRLHIIDEQIQRTLQDMTAGLQKVLQDMRKHAGDERDAEEFRAEIDSWLLARLTDEVARLSSTVDLASSRLTTELIRREEQLVRSRHEMRKAQEESVKYSRALSFWSKVLVVATFFYVFLLGSLVWTVWNEFDVTQQHIQQPIMPDTQVTPR